MLNMENTKHRQLVKQYGRTEAKKMLAGGGFAATLHAAVDASDFTRVQLANEIHCSKPALDKWLNGTQYPASHFLLRICVALYAVYDDYGNIINNDVVNEHCAAFMRLQSLER